MHTQQRKNKRIFTKNPKVTKKTKFDAPQPLSHHIKIAAGNSNNPAAMIVPKKLFRLIISN